MKQVVAKSGFVRLEPHLLREKRVHERKTVGLSLMIQKKTGTWVRPFCVGVRLLRLSEANSCFTSGKREKGGGRKLLLLPCWGPYFSSRPAKSPDQDL